MDSTLIPRRYSDVTPSDTTSLGPTIGLYVGGAGTVKASGLGGAVGTFVCQAGQVIPGEFRQVLATGTTATSIVAMYGG